MKKKNESKIWIVATVFMALMVTAFPLSVNGQVEASGLSFGTQVGEYNGVTAYSNYENDYVSDEYNYVDAYNTGMKWQCVEYVNRYYYIVYGLEIRIPGTNAEDYYETASDRGLIAYPNGDTTSPQPGDILCSNGGTLGHVAIVREVTVDSIHVIHQNWANTAADNDKTISMSVSDGHYTVSGFSGSYPVQGWLRKPIDAIYVPDDYAMIQWAVNNASAGDTIILRDGNYNENVEVNKSITIRSENGSSNCIVQAANQNNHVFEVTADYVNISGFTVKGTIGHTKAGIYLNNVNNCNISNNNASNNDCGIKLKSSNNNTISNNNASKSVMYNGISLKNSNYNNITGNVLLSNNHNGIWINASSNNIISNNNASNSIMYSGISMKNSNYNNITGNMLLSNSHNGIWINASSNNIISNNNASNSVMYSGLGMRNSNYNNIIGNSLLSNNHNGIWMEDSSYITITNNICSCNRYGIDLYYSNDNSITNNNCSSNNYHGIDLTSSNDNVITNNSCSSNNYHGIHLDHANNNNLTGNTMLENGIFIFSQYLFYYLHEIDESNTVNGKPVYYWKDVNGGRIPDGAGQVILVNCKDVIVENQNLTEGSVGIEVAFSSNITIKNSNCSSNNWYGIYLDYSNDNCITNNNCSNSNNEGGIFLRFSNNNSLSNNNYSSNDWGGIWLIVSNDNCITNNNCSNNRVGIDLWDSNDNCIYLNNFINNTDNVDSHDSTNIWNSTSKITYTYNESTHTNYLGNYWSDYTDVDANDDGIWDYPRGIDFDWDYHPLVEPFENYPAPTENIFDTGSPANPYPSIMGNHTGTIKPNHTVIATKLYTYPCAGTGGHTEYARIGNKTWNATATWEGYAGDWHNISFDKTVVLLAGETYDYTIHTGSYPQIIHESPFNATGGEITCTKFTDANGKVYYDWIPAIWLWA